MSINPKQHTCPLTMLGDISVEQFLRDYWQQKPLLIKGAFEHLDTLIGANELAGLSLDEESQSRLVIQSSSDRNDIENSSAPRNWTVKHGPFEEADFQELPETDWSLLVQHVDALDPNVNSFLAFFRFLPNWRIDDIMVSYATDQGGVGPHFDYYDVFLLQGAGQKRWRIGQTCDNSSPLIPNQPMKILEQFDTQYDWHVETGDLIYIPAKLAHWGEAIGESITYSIGFRAPSHSELLIDSTQHFAAELNDDHRYTDADELLNNTPSGLIPNSVITRLQTELTQLIQQPEKLALWLGEYATQLKPGLNPEHLPLDFATHKDWENGSTLQLSSFCRAAYIDSETVTTKCTAYPEDTARAQCFINGDAYIMSSALAARITSYLSIDRSQVLDEDEACILQLIDEQKLIIK